MTEKCSISTCKAKEVAIIYLGKPLCNKCWDKYAAKPVEKLRAALGIKEAKNGRGNLQEGRGVADVDVNKLPNGKTGQDDIRVEPRDDGGSDGSKDSAPAVPVREVS